MKKTPPAPSLKAAQLKLQNDLEQQREQGEIFRAIGQVMRAFDPPVAYGGAYNFDYLANALESHMVGRFSESGKLCEYILEDDQIAGTLNTRVGNVTALFCDKKALTIKPSGTSEAHLRAAKFIKEHFHELFSGAVIEEAIRDELFLGFSCWQILYSENWTPRLERWHPSFTYYNIVHRAFVAMTSNQGSTNDETIMNNSGGKWFVYSPYSLYRCWIRGGIRPLSPLWLKKQYALRDWGRYATAYGNFIKMLKLPTKVDAPTKARVLKQLQNIQSESVIPLIQGRGPEASWDLDIFTPPTGGPDVFSGLVEYVDKKFATYVLGQNVTTDLQAGSRNAVEVLYEGTTLGKARNDITSLQDRFVQPIVKQIIRLLFGSEKLAPIVEVSAESIKYQTGSSEQDSRIEASQGDETKSGNGKPKIAAKDYEEDPSYEDDGKGL
jgi:phage gp29-like protein